MKLFTLKRFFVVSLLMCLGVGQSWGETYWEPGQCDKNGVCTIDDIKYTISPVPSKDSENKRYVLTKGQTYTITWENQKCNDYDVVMTNLWGQGQASKSLLAWGKRSATFTFSGCGTTDSGSNANIGTKITDIEVNLDIRDQIRNKGTITVTPTGDDVTYYLRQVRFKYDKIDIATADLSNSVILPSSYYTPATPWTAATWVALSKEAYGKPEDSSNDNFNQIQGTPSKDANNKDWNAADFNVDGWESHTSAFSGNGAYQWAADKFGDIYFCRKFKATGTKPTELYLSVGHDDAPCEYYLNGHKIWGDDGFTKPEPWKEDDVVKLTSEEIGWIKTDGSVNILAVHVHQNWGGYLADVGLYKTGTEAANAYEKSLVEMNNRFTELAPWATYLANNANYKKATELKITARSLSDYKYIYDPAQGARWSLLKDIKVATLDEDATNVTSTATYDAALVKRSFTGGRWNTFCVPFDMTIDELTKALGTNNGVEIKELVGAEDNDNNGSYTLKFDTAEEINAGQCYLVWVTNSIAKDNFAVGGANVTVTADLPEASEEFDVVFQGTYNKRLAPYGSYIISNNMFYCVNSDVNVKAFRGWFVIPGETSEGSALNVVFDDDNVTGITSVSNGNDNGNDNLYNIAGQRVNENAKGIIIKNGKKYLVK